MGLLIAIVILALLIFIMSKTQNHKNANKNSSYYSTTNILTTILILLSIIQAPLIYYYLFGFFPILSVLVFILFSLIMVVILICATLKKVRVSNFQLYGVLIAFLYGFISLLIDIEKLDWKFRLSERNKIVEKVLNGEYTEKRLKTNYFPPISNGGNEVFIDNNPNGGITVTFYINRGFLDHYSAFVYTTDSTKLNQFNAWITSKSNKVSALDKHWYRIAEEY